MAHQYLNSPIQARTVIRSTAEQEDRDGFFRTLLYRPADPAGNRLPLREYDESDGVHGVVDNVVIPGSRRAAGSRTVDGQKYVLFEVNGGAEQMFMLKEYTRGPRTAPGSPRVLVQNDSDLGIPQALASVEGKLTDFLETVVTRRSSKNRYKVLSDAEVTHVRSLLYGAMTPGANADDITRMIYEVCCSDSLTEFVKADGSRVMQQGAAAVARFDTTFAMLQETWPDLSRELLFTVLRFDFDSFSDLHVEHLSLQLQGADGHVIALYEQQDSASKTNRGLFDEGVSFFQLIWKKVLLEGRDLLEAPFLYLYADQISHIEKTQYSKHRAVSDTILRLISQFGTQCRDALRRAIKSPSIVFVGLDPVTVFKSRLWYNPGSPRYQEFERRLLEVGAREFGIMALRAEFAASASSAPPPSVPAPSANSQAKKKTLTYHASGPARGFPKLVTAVPRPVRQLDAYKDTAFINCCSEFAQVGQCSRDSCSYHHLLPSKRSLDEFFKNYEVPEAKKKSVLTRLKGVAQKFPDLPAISASDTVSTAKAIYG